MEQLRAKKGFIIDMDVSGEEGISFPDEFKPLHTEGAAEETGMDGT